MVLSMVRPTPHSKTGVFYYRGRVPADLLKLKGGGLVVTIAGEQARVTLGEHFKVSLRTKNPGEARSRNAEVETQLQSYWSSARSGELTLSFEQVCALAGDWYRDEIASHEQEPGISSDWETMKGLIADALFHFERDEDGRQRNPKMGEEQLLKLIPIARFLEGRGLALSSECRRSFVEQAGGVMWRMSTRLEQLAEGDYSEDKTLKTFPAWRGSHIAPERGSEGLLEVFERWAKEGERAPSTTQGYRGYIKHFVETVGHKDLSQINRQDVVQWKDALVARGDAPKTINDSKLAALKAVLNWAVDNAIIPTNPATGVSVSNRRRAGNRMREFEKAEAAAIFAAAEKETSRVYRWVPALCALSGARVAEVCQLRAEDIQQEGGIHFFDINGEAGSVKNESSIRRVPLHPYLLKEGFLEFVRERGSGPLFYDPDRRREGSKKPQEKIVAKNVGRWVHTLGLAVGREFRKDPNHAWRHYFTTIAHEAEISDSVIDRLTGHAPPSVGRRYGSVPLSTLARAIERIAVPKHEGVRDNSSGDQTK